MLKAWLRALRQLFSPALRRVVALSLAITVASFVVLWLVVAFVLGHLPTIGWRPLNWIVELLGVVGVALLSWLLFPAVATMIMGLFIERIAAAVEALDYPGRGASRRQSIRETMTIGLRPMLLSIVLNLLALPIYILLPGINVFVFLGLNGYLFGREYFETVALRRLDTAAVTQLRHRCAGRIFFAGVMIAGMFAVPVINLVAPVVATAFMLHVFEGLPRPAPANGAF